VALDDRAANGKAHSHAPWFRSEQWFENAIHVGWINSVSGVLDQDMHSVVFGNLGFYGKHARLCRTHGLDGIHHQIQNDLLQLDLIPKDGRKVLAEVRATFNAVLSQVDIDQSKN
jgi:hypothetical protein